MTRQGFTLIELITVTAIIGLLMAMSVSVSRSARLRAKSVQCRANIRQLVIAFISYGTDNSSFPFGFRDTLVSPSGGHAGDLAYDRMGLWWFDYLGNYHSKSVEGPTNIDCPSKRLDDFKLMSNVLCGNYGVNQSICKSAYGSPQKKEFIGRPLKQHEIKHPGQTLLLVDAGYALINWWHASDCPPQQLLPLFVENTSYVPGLAVNETREFMPGQKNDAVMGRHPGKTVNVGFADGHAEMKRSGSLRVDKVETGYTNRRPLWQPR